MNGKNIALDIGSANIKAFISGKGVIFSEANAIAYDNTNGEIVAIGNSAADMLEKQPETIKVKVPIKSGIIYDFDALQSIVTHITAKFSAGELLKPNFLVCVPSSCTPVQKKIIIDMLCTSGAGKVSLIDTPLASAYGCAVDIERPFGNLIVDIGAGTTDVAAISMKMPAASATIGIGGDNFDEAICQFIRFEKHISISKQEARRLKHTIGCAKNDGENVEMFFRGMDVVSRLPKYCSITTNEMSFALSNVLKKITAQIHSVIEQIPEQMYIDICSGGMILTGGSAKLLNLDAFLAETFNIPIFLNPDGANSSVKGAGYILKNLNKFDNSGLMFKIIHRNRFVT